MVGNVLPHAIHSEAGFPPCPPPWNEDEEVRERFRTIRAALRTIANPRSCVAVTCTVAGEGVSWIAARLACAAAEDTGAVVLVDANRIHPCQRERFGLDGPEPPRTTGPGPALVSSRTIWPQLSVVSPEVDPGSPVEASAAALHQALCALRGVAGVIVVDCEPMRDSAQVLHLAGAVDAVLYVIEAEFQRREVIAHAQEALRRAGIPILGVVLNKRKRYIPAPIYRLL